jgi:hypothetical protein
MTVGRSGPLWGWLAWVLGAAALGCGGDRTGPSRPPYYMLVADGRCDAGVATDTVMQPGNPPGSPNAGSGVIEGPPRRTSFWVLGSSRSTGIFAQLLFMLVDVPSPLPVGTYPVRALADSTVWVEDYWGPQQGAGFPTDMNTARVSGTSFIVEPLTGSIVVEESDATGAVGTFTLRGRYVNAVGTHCLSASGRFSTRPY